MNVQCLVGFHRWRGCQCCRCGRTRDEQHDWRRDCGGCVRCGKKRPEGHTWDGCKCTMCGITKTDAAIRLLRDKTVGAEVPTLSEQEMIESLGEKALPALIAFIREAKNNSTHVRWGAALLAQAGEKGVEALCALRDEEGWPCNAMFGMDEAICGVSDPRAYEPLARAFIQAPRKETLRALGRIGDARLADTLLAAISPFFRTAILSYGKGEFDFREWMDPDILAEVVDHLGKTRNPRVIRPLADLFDLLSRISRKGGGRGYDEVSDALVKALRALGGVQDAVWGLAPVTIEELAEQLASGHGRAFHRLLISGGEPAEALLHGYLILQIHCLHRDLWRAELKQVMSDDEAEALMTYTTTPACWTHEEKKWAAFFLKRARTGVASYIEQLARGSPEERAAACGRLHLAMVPEAVPALVRVLEEDTAFGLRSLAAMALGVIGDASALEPLRRALTQREPDFGNSVVMLGELTANPDFVRDAIRQIEAGSTERFLQTLGIETG